VLGVVVDVYSVVCWNKLVWSVNGLRKLSLAPIACFLPGSWVLLSASRGHVLACRGGQVLKGTYLPPLRTAEVGAFVYKTPNRAFPNKNHLDAGRPADQPKATNFLSPPNIPNDRQRKTRFGTFLSFRSNARYSCDIATYIHLDHIHLFAHYGDSPNATRDQTNGCRRLGR
jgi:hypothetical protein